MDIGDAARLRYSRALSDIAVPMKMPVSRDIVVVHSSDLHVDHDYTARLHGGDGAAGLACVLDAACGIKADIVILAGDTFDSHRVPQHLVERAAAVIERAVLPVVVLPGNHDPAVNEAVYRRDALKAVKNLHVIGVTHDESVVFDGLSLEIWGRAHRDYADMIPLDIARHEGRRRRTRWQIAVAHGHYEPAADRGAELRPAWLISDAEIAATGADYVALGHWNRATPVGNGMVPAYYCGSPEYAGTVNVVRLSDAKGVTVSRASLDIVRERPE
jgi:DNA repair exonuclease SbcCD nuclease subunit